MKYICINYTENLKQGISETFKYSDNVQYTHFCAFIPYLIMYTTLFWKLTVKSPRFVYFLRIWPNILAKSDNPSQIQLAIVSEIFVKIYIYVANIIFLYTKQNILKPDRENSKILTILRESDLISGQFWQPWCEAAEFLNLGTTGRTQILFTAGIYI